MLAAQQYLRSLILDKRSSGWQNCFCNRKTNLSNWCFFWINRKSNFRRLSRTVSNWSNSTQQCSTDKFERLKAHPEISFRAEREHTKKFISGILRRPRPIDAHLLGPFDFQEEGVFWQGRVAKAGFRTNAKYLALISTRSNTTGIETYRTSVDALAFKFSQYRSLIWQARCTIKGWKICTCDKF